MESPAASPRTVIPPSTVIPAYAGISPPVEARKRRISPLPIRGEDAANAAGEGTVDGAHSAPSFPTHDRHSRVGGNLAPFGRPSPLPAPATLDNPRASGMLGDARERLGQAQAYDESCCVRWPCGGRGLRPLRTHLGNEALSSRNLPSHRPQGVLHAGRVASPRFAVRRRVARLGGAGVLGPSVHAFAGANGRSLYAYAAHARNHPYAYAGAHGHIRS